MTTPPETETTDTRSRLREVALDLFGRQGIHETSTRQIIKTAGLKNPSAITYYFGSKANLVEDLTREVNGSRYALLQQHVALATAARAARRPTRGPRSGSTSCST